MDSVRSADGTPIAYDRTGEGPALVLVNGALADRQASRALANRLASEFTVYAYDRRGRGSSGDRSPYAVQRELEDLDALIVTAGGSARLFGHSSGAVLALAAAAQGLPVVRLAAYEPPFIVDDTRARPPDDLSSELRALLAADRRADAVRLFWTAAVELPPQVITMMEASPMWTGAQALAHTLPYDVDICGPGNRMAPDQLAAISVPTLVLDGGESPDWARHAVEAVAATIPKAQRITLDGQTHGADEHVLAPVLTEFLA